MDLEEPRSVVRWSAHRFLIYNKGMKRTAHSSQSLQTWLLPGTSFPLPSEVFLVSLGNIPLDNIILGIRGKNEPVMIYTVLGRKGAPMGERVRTLEA